MKVLFRSVYFFALLLALAGTTLFPYAGSAQQFNFKNLERDSLKTGVQLRAHGLSDTIVVSHDKWDEMVSSGAGYAANFKFKSVHAFVRFSVDHAYGLEITAPYTLRLTFKVYGFSNPATPNTVSGYSEDTLTIGYHPDSLATYQDKQFMKYSNYHKVMIVLTGLYKIDGAGAPPQVITLGPGSSFNLVNFNVEGAIVFQPYYKKAFSGSSYYNAYGSNGALKIQGLTPTNDYLPVSWTVSGATIGGALALTPAKYELEWTYVDNYSVTPTSGSLNGTVSEIPASQLHYTFDDNATRVWLDTNYYQIPMIYQKGHVLYRVRLVRPDSTEYRYPVYGPWTLANATGTVSSVENANRYQVTAAHLNDSLNWQYTVSFAEQGKYKHVMSYYDGMLKNRQNITRFNSMPGKLIATEQVYDYEGRPSISILPTPVSSLAFRYQLNLSLNRNTGLPYRAKDFDSLLLSVCPADPLLPPLSHSSPADIYYSPNNPDKAGFQKYVPDAGGYPLVQTIYSPGYDERVEKQGGAGDTLQIGYDHTVKNSYVGSEQMDINRIFGTNIGWAGFYRKTVSRDPNGQFSINISDYKGKTMMSSMVGMPDTVTHALTINENVPGVTQFTEDFIAGTSQLIIGNKRILDKNFFNEAGGNNGAVYGLKFKPFATFCPNKFLTVKTAFEYTIFNECGVIKKHRDSVIGHTGIVTSGNIIAYADSQQNFFMDQGKHSLNKVLTVNTNEIDKAVDTFMLAAQADGCLKTEPWFIKEAVLSKQFPCPDDISKADPNSCEGKKYAMIKELYPNEDGGSVIRKYGYYKNINGVAVGSDNSDFTLYCGTGNPSLWGSYPAQVIDDKQGPVSIVGNWTNMNPPAPAVPGSPFIVLTNGDTLNCRYRYQDPCVVTMPASVTKYGQTYTNLQQIPVQDFINIFNDDIAEALLPLHPEYCNLLGCVDDPFGKKLQSIPDAHVAEQLGLLYLNAIANADPLYAVMSTNGQYPSALDTLTHLSGGTLSLNYLALTNAYCGSMDANMLATCQSDMFASQIASGTLLNDFVKEAYFKSIRDLYIGNRSRYLFNLNTNGFAAGGCAVCAPIRMDLIPQPVFDTDSLSDMIAVMDSLMTGLSTANSGGVVLGAGNTSAVVGAYLNLIDTVDLDTLVSYSNAAVNTYTSVSNTIMQAAVDSMVADLLNCYSPSGGTLNGVKTYLLNLYNTGQVPALVFTPAQVRAALVANNFTLDDLCNPYLVSYDDLMAAPENDGGSSMMCGNPVLFEDMTNFMNLQSLQALQNPGTAYTVALGSINQFELGLSSQLGNVSSCSVQAAIDTPQHRYTLTYTAGAATVKVYLSTAASGNCAYPFVAASGETVSLGVQCTKDVFNGFPSGYVSNYSFALVAKKVSGSGTSYCNIKGWNNKITINNPGGNPIADCVPCTQMRSLYTQFWDTLTAYIVKGADHPYYNTMLRNFMNHRLKKTFSGGQYQDFVVSCALADSMHIPKYPFYEINIRRSASEAAAFINLLNTMDPQINAEQIYYFKVTNETYHDFAFNLNGVPKDKYRTFLNALAPYEQIKNVSFTHYLGSNFAGRLLIPDAVAFDPNTGFFNGAPGSLTFTLDNTYLLWNGTGFESFKLYNAFTPNLSAHARNSEMIDSINSFLVANQMDGRFVPAFASTINEDYNKPEKKAYLNYVYNYQQVPANKVLDTLQAPVLQSGITMFNGMMMSYGHPARPGAIENLYIGNPATMTNNTHFGKLQYILGQVSNSLSGGLFFSGANAQAIPQGGSQMLTAYRCSDTAYWYRYFGPGDTLYNVFVRVPQYLTASQLASYTVTSLSANLGDGNSRSFKLVLHSSSSPIPNLTLNGYTDFTVARNTVLKNVLLAHPLNAGIPIADTINNCERTKLEGAIVEGKIRYRNYIDSIRNRTRTAFFAYVMNGALEESLDVSYANQRFNYTLYNYDRAGNLMATVPPAGVSPLATGAIAGVDASRSNGTDNLPGHNKKSTYYYNTLNLVVEQQTPDGGRTEYFYDAAGRAIFAQNEKQRPTGRMTYTLYDKQGRIVETGQAVIACAPYFPPYTSVNPYTTNPCSHYVGGVVTPFPPEVQELKFKTHDEVTAYVRALQREEVVVTHYDFASVDLQQPAQGLSGQENLRKRVSDIKYFDYLQPIDSLNQHYNYAMHFSYDISGNVKTLTRDYPAWKISGQQFKRIDYDYDEISGKVNLLSYNRSFADQYYQRYDYDADNRIVKVETSSDGYIWQRDAEYQYYQHGPLARMSLGDLRVQGVDYAYTIQGWLKAINGDLLDSLKDMGRDGMGNSIHAYDAVALSLDYYKGDYKPIGDSVVIHTSAPLKSLYNGNIPRATTSLSPFPDLASNYTYDQLNRIIRADYATLNRQDATLTNTANYYSKYAYDPDGNLKKLVRNGNNPAALQMDSLVYRYTNNASADNKLQNVNDYAANNYDNDLKLHTNAAISRYLYDATGNVIRDQVSGQDTIVWNHYNKVLDTRNDSIGNGLRFAYDGAGNRFMKTVTKTIADTTLEKSDYYVRDAQGNILAIYAAEDRYEMAKTEWIEYIMVEYANQLSQNELLTWVIKPYYAQDGYFKSYATNYIASNKPYLLGVIDAFPMSLFIKNYAIKSDLLSHTGDYADFYQKLNAYSAATGQPVLGSAVYNYTLAENNIGNFIESMKNGPTEIRQRVLEVLCSSTDSLFKHILVEYMGQPYDTGGCSVNVPVAMDAIGGDFHQLGGFIASSVEQQGYHAEYLSFLNALTQDSVVMNFGQYTMPDEGGEMIPDFQAALQTYANDSLLGAFLDSWGDSKELLGSVAGPHALLQVAYDYDPVGLLGSFISTAEGGAQTILYQSLAAIPTLNPFEFTNKLSTAVVVDSILHTVYESVLKYQRISLSSHHLYGSSRLGTKDYLPGQYYLLWDNSGPGTILDTTTLKARRPWYSLEYNDNISALTVAPWSMTDISAYLVSHQVGQKQYELTNHLGNVQATVSDLPYAGGEYYITRKAPALPAVYDYYPFGMLMPGRYTSDTTGKCMTISQTKWVTNWMDSCYLTPALYTATIGGAVVNTTGGTLNVSTSNVGDGIELTLPGIVPGVEQELNFEFEEVYRGTPQIWVTEEQNGVQVSLGSVLVRDKGTTTLRVKSKFGNIKVLVLDIYEVKMKKVCVKVPQLIQQEMLVDVCSDMKDRYRFGFNGQEKVNEWSGVGNWTTAKFWEYDTRSATRKNVDIAAAKYPYHSPYMIFGGNPLIFVDPNGDDYFYLNAHGICVAKVEIESDNDVFYLINDDLTVDYIHKYIKNGEIPDARGVEGNDWARLTDKQKVGVVNSSYLIHSGGGTRFFREPPGNLTEFGMDKMNLSHVKSWSRSPTVNRDGSMTGRASTTSGDQNEVIGKVAVNGKGIVSILAGWPVNPDHGNLDDRQVPVGTGLPTPLFGEKLPMDPSIRLVPFTTVSTIYAEPSRYGKDCVEVVNQYVTPDGKVVPADKTETRTPLPCQDAKTPIQ